MDGPIVVGEILDNESGNFGFDAQTEEYVNMVEAGIIDPAKVVRVALQDAASVAGLLVNEAMVAEKPKEGTCRCRRYARRNGWNGWHGRHGFLIQLNSRARRRTSWPRLAHSMATAQPRQYPAWRRPLCERL